MTKELKYYLEEENKKILNKWKILKFLYSIEDKKLNKNVKNYSIKRLREIFK